MYIYIYICILYTHETAGFVWLVQSKPHAAVIGFLKLAVILDGKYGVIELHFRQLCTVILMYIQALQAGSGHLLEMSPQKRTRICRCACKNMLVILQWSHSAVKLLHIGASPEPGVSWRQLFWALPSFLSVSTIISDPLQHQMMQHNTQWYTMSVQPNTGACSVFSNLNKYAQDWGQWGQVRKMLSQTNLSGTSVGFHLNRQTFPEVSSPMIISWMKFLNSSVYSTAELQGLKGLHENSTFDSWGTEITKAWCNLLCWSVLVSAGQLERNAFWYFLDTLARRFKLDANEFHKEVGPALVRHAKVYIRTILDNPHFVSN